ncbi:MAG: hypothetical protein AB7E61_00965 [Acholeplasmataceae bacterium]
MKMIEKLIYAFIVFVALYVIIAVGLRIFDLTTTFNAHVFAGIIATIVGVFVFIFLLIKKKQA